MYLENTAILGQKILDVRHSNKRLNNFLQPISNYAVHSTNKFIRHYSFDLIITNRCEYSVDLKRKLLISDTLNYNKLLFRSSTILSHSFNEMYNVPPSIIPLLSIKWKKIFVYSEQKLVSIPTATSVKFQNHTHRWMYPSIYVSTVLYLCMYILTSRNKQVSQYSKGQYQTVPISSKLYTPTIRRKNKEDPLRRLTNKIDEQDFGKYSGAGCSFAWCKYLLGSKSVKSTGGALRPRFHRGRRNRLNGRRWKPFSPRESFVPKLQYFHSFQVYLSITQEQEK